MKRYILLIIMSTSFIPSINAQTAIGKREVSSPAAVLDFAAGTTKGIILPAVEIMPTSPANGTFLFDKTAKIIKMFSNGSWVNLSDVGNVSAVVPYSGSVQNGKQTIMGSHTTKVLDGSNNYVDGAVDGVLVLESPNKAMVLPKIASPHLNVVAPYPGMMCYDTIRKSLAVFNGSAWNYWK